jgi:hypothetical protein
VGVLLILTTLLTIEGVAFVVQTFPTAPTNFKAIPGDSKISLSWKAPDPLPNPPTLTYEYQYEGGGQTPSWTNIGDVRTFEIGNLTNGTPYTVKVRAKNQKGAGPASEAIVTPLGAAPRAPQSLKVERDEDTATLTWSPPRDPSGDIIRYEYSADGGSTWKSTGSSSTRHTVRDLEIGEEYTFRIRAVYAREGGTSGYIYISHPSTGSNAVELSLKRKKSRIFDCPVGWVRSDGFAGRNRRALLYEVKVDMDIHNRISIYKPVWVAIYVHPDEALENLDGWKLQVALPYNRHSEYLLTAENSVVVDAGFVEGGFAFIEPPQENPFPMTGMGFPGSPAPGFDYRLYDDSGRRVDFGISCYKRFDIFQVLRNTEDRRVLRKVLLESFDWDSHYLRSEWTVATPAPAAPSLIKGNIVGTWADLKKQ